MRALCGAIITAGAAIGLGLTAIGFGTRYQATPAFTGDGQTVLSTLYRMDRSLVFILVFLTCIAVIGLGIAFLGLMYHHHRRYHEMLRTHPPESTVTPRV